MSRLPQEDLFDGSKMSFGEHLEELRLALVRSLFGLGIAAVFGFYFADRVIDFVETPLLEALDRMEESILEVQQGGFAVGDYPPLPSGNVGF